VNPPTVTVATWNLSLGVRLARLFEVRSTDELHRTVGNLLESAREHPYDARLDAIADELAATGPAVVAVQEAASVRERPAGGDADEWATVVDVPDRLESALADAGLSYERAASVETADLELRGETDGGARDVQFTDRDALLVRSDVEWRDPATGTYDAQLGLPTSEIEFERGFCTADVTVGDRTLTAASTHLESVSASVRRRQAEELGERLPADGRVALAGDFNSGPGGDTEAYELLGESFTDPWPQLRPDEDGFTCCQGQRLTNEASLLDERVDAVLVRGGLRPTAVERLGHRPEDRVSATRDGESVTVWPSDHAGVVGTFAVTAAATPTPSPTASPTSTPSPTANNPTRQTNDTGTAGRDGGPFDPTASPAPGSAGEGDGVATETDDGPSIGLGPGFGAGALVVGAALAAVGLLRGRRGGADRTHGDRRE
jgi:endonuclease/exonuclease/phosphatase family metal-dependent hydrolase